MNTSSSRYIPDLVPTLLKHATMCKKAGDWDTAIISLRQAYAEIENISTIYGIETYLRLPMYLHQAGRKKEAWAAFQSLLHGHYKKMNDGSRRFEHFDKGQICDKIRLCLQRDGQRLQAVKYGVASWLCETAARKKQAESRDERDVANSALEYLLNPECIEDQVRGLLKSTDKEDVAPKLASYVTLQARNGRIPLRLNEITREVDRILGLDSEATSQL